MARKMPARKPSCKQLTSPCRMLNTSLRLSLTELLSYRESRPFFSTRGSIMTGNGLRGVRCKTDLNAAGHSKTARRTTTPSNASKCHATHVDGLSHLPQSTHTSQAKRAKHLNTQKHARKHIQCAHIVRYPSSNDSIKGKNHPN